MDIDDDDMDQAPSSSTGTKGEKKRFEVKKVKNWNYFLCISFNLDRNFNDISLWEISLDNKAFEGSWKNSIINWFALLCFSGML